MGRAGKGPGIGRSILSSDWLVAMLQLMSFLCECCKIESTSFPGSLFSASINDNGGREERPWERGWNWISYSKWEPVRRRRQLRFFPKIRFVCFAQNLKRVILIYYNHKFSVFFGSCDRPMPGPFPALSIFLGKKPWERCWLFERCWAQIKTVFSFVSLLTRGWSVLLTFLAGGWLFKKLFWGPLVFTFV